MHHFEAIILTSRLVKAGPVEEDQSFPELEFLYSNNPKS